MLLYIKINYRTDKENMAQIISMLNFKGGVGKTSLCVWTAAWLERKLKGKKKIIVIDLDNQPAATKYMHGKPMTFNKYMLDYKDNNICKVLDGSCEVAKAIQTRQNKMDSRIGKIDYIFGSKDCTADYFSEKGININKALSNLIDDLEKLNYDYILIDCHPGSSELEDATIALSDLCIIPAIPELIEISGMLDMLQYCAVIPSRRNRINAVVLNRCENKTIHNSIKRECQKFIDNPKFSGYFFKSSIDSCTFASQAINRNELLPYFKPQCKTSQGVKNMVEELLQLLGEGNE